MKLADIFKIEECSRCGGGGRYSYCAMYGDTCFKCNGTGKQYTKADAPLAEDYLSARRKATEASTHELRAGDFIADPRDENMFTSENTGKQLRPWVEVASIEATSDAEGASARIMPDGSRATFKVTLVDGYAFKGIHIVKRRADLKTILSLCKNPETVRRVRDATEAPVAA